MGSNVEYSQSEIMDHLNSCMHHHINKLLTTDRGSPFQCDTLSIDNAISHIDPSLWSAITALTRSVSERKCPLKTADQSDPSYKIKKIRQFFCFCCLVFCTDNRCNLPLHNLITDAIESYGGSTVLVKILNRLGACSSTDTLARSIQSYIRERERRGPEQECLPDYTTIISVDNIDFLHSYAKVFCGDQLSSWHGTTVQAVQPLPSVLEKDTTTSPTRAKQPVAQKRVENVIAVPDTVNGVTQQTKQPCDITSHPQRSVRKRVSSILSPFSSPSTGKSPTSKIQRRARTEAEEECPTVTHDVTLQLECNHGSTYGNQPCMTIANFQICADEAAALDNFCSKMCTYMLQKQVSVCGTKIFLNVKDYFKLHSGSTCKREKSEITYLQVMDAISDSKDTMMAVLQDLHRQFVVNQKKEYLIVEGDAKIYEVLQSLKYEYGNDLKWVLVYPGDWHTLKNFQSVLMKVYYDAGLKQLAQSSGYPVAGIQTCSQFKRTHAFIMEAWEALYRSMLQKHFESNSACRDNITRIIQSLSLSQATNSNTTLTELITELILAVQSS